MKNDRLPKAVFLGRSSRAIMKAVSPRIQIEEPTRKDLKGFESLLERIENEP